MTREPLDLEALRRREVQMMGAAISTRSWHNMENAYNQLRDKIDAELTRLHLATKDADDPQSRGQAFDGEALGHGWGSVFRPAGIEIKQSYMDKAQKLLDEFDPRKAGSSCKPTKDVANWILATIAR